MFYEDHMEVLTTVSKFSQIRGGPDIQGMNAGGEVFRSQFISVLRDCFHIDCFICFLKTGHSKVVQAALLTDVLIHPGH